MKTCSKCKKEKLITDFYIKERKSGRLHAQCKNCYRQQRKINYASHYEKYQESYRNRARDYRNKLREEFRGNLSKYMEDKYCVDCSEADPVVLELDHIDPKDKLFSISQSVRLGHRWEAVEKELRKCRVLCSNCHKRRTAKQFSWHNN